MIRLATLDDMDELVRLAKMYSGESTQHRELSIERTKQTFDAHINSAGSAVHVADTAGGGLACASITVIDYSFTVRPQALVCYFYMTEPFRGTGLSRQLLAECVKFAQDNNCSHVWAGAHALIDAQSTKMFENLCSKQGFQQAAMTMFKRF